MEKKIQRNNQINGVMDEASPKHSEGVVCFVS